MTCDAGDVAGENVGLSKPEKLGPEVANDDTNCTEQDRINVGIPYFCD